jgi:hypothetical protein
MPVRRPLCWLEVGSFMKSSARALVLMGLTFAAIATPAVADEWFPDTANAHWQYSWSDSAYNPNGTVENLVVQQAQGSSFTLAWADPTDQPPPAGSSTFSCPQSADIGDMSFQDTSIGLVNTDWNDCPPPSTEPVLCSAATNCSNSLASTLFLLMWGDRSPVLSEPLLQGTTWNATGGADGSVASTSTYLGEQLVKVPAFPSGVKAAVVQSNVEQQLTSGYTTGYGSGVRTVWWVYGVGPVKVVFEHAGGGGAPVSTASLLSTNLKPMTPPPDQNYFPLKQGLTDRYRWTNSKHLKQPEVESVSVDTVVNRSAHIAVNSVSGPIKVAGEYAFNDIEDGVMYGGGGPTSVATFAKFPRLANHQHLFTPLDLMLFGSSMLLPAYPAPGDSWSSSASDFHTFGATVHTRIIGIRAVHVPAGTFHALEVQSTLTERGHPFGSGVRTCWFANGLGLVKLVFRHRDGSVSTVTLLK